MGSPDNIGVAIQIIRSLVRACESIGVDMDGPLKEAGIQRDELNEVEARVPIIKEHRLWNAVAEVTGNQSIGLYAAQHLTAGDFDVLDYAIRTSNTLGDALENLCRYNRLLHDIAQLTLETNDSLVSLKHELPNVPGLNPCRHAVEFTFASIVTVGKQLCGKEFAPQTVHFSHPAPTLRERYNGFFSCQVTFDCSQNLISFDTEVLAWPIADSDSGLNSVLKRHADQLLSQIPIEKSLTDRVRQLVLEYLQNGYKGIDEIASRLHMTPRSLQRKLRAEQTSYNEIVNDLKMKLAKSYLLERNLSISETAYLLGYSEVSAFRRAFKRWLGLTPDSYRKSRSIAHG